MTAKFIVFEGIDGCGKSTVLREVANCLRRQGKTVLETREPGSSPMSEAIRGLISTDTPRTPQTELFLQEAARSDSVHNIVLPAMNKYDYILQDRYIYSTTAYQGAGGNDPQTISNLNSMATDSLMPNLAFLINVDLETALKRRQKRDGIADKFDRHFDQIDDYAKRVFANYQWQVKNKLLVSVDNYNLDAATGSCLSYIEDLK